VRAINEGIAKLEDGSTVRFLDLGAQFLQPDGELRQELFKDDRLHLAARGYKVWADALDPALAEALKP
jgi:lysophospholipase L1-like esterase